MYILEFIASNALKDPYESNKDRLIRIAPEFESLEPRNKNIVKFFTELGNDFGYNYPLLLPQGLSGKKKEDFLSVTEEKKSHTRVPLIGRPFADVSKLYWGLVDFVEIKGGKETYLGTVVHSFLHRDMKGKPNKIYDPMFFGMSLRLGKVFEGRNYFGVHIPYRYLDQWAIDPDTFNYSYFLQKNAFSESYITDRVIAELRKHQQVFPQRLLPEKSQATHV